VLGRQLLKQRSGPAPDRTDCPRSLPGIEASSNLPGIEASSNPASRADRTGNLSRGDECGLRGKRQSGYCVGPFGQDAWSIYRTGCAIAKR